MPWFSFVSLNIGSTNLVRMGSTKHVNSAEANVTLSQIVQIYSQLCD